LGGFAIQKMEEVKLIDKFNVANVALDMFKFQIHQPYFFTYNNPYNYRPGAS